MTGETFKILASPADTADQLKLLIERQEGTPKAHHKLICGANA
jgi:uncharacterized protein YbaR (Trm112 family)